MMNFLKLFNNVFLVAGSSKEELAKVFVRMQGCVDSSEFRGKIFTLQEYEKWFSDDGKNNLYNSFVGYNVPDYVINLFINNSFKDISTPEKWLINNLIHACPPKPYYVIGYIYGQSATLKHELAHALYYLNPIYKEQADLVVKDFIRNSLLDNLNKIYAFFKKVRYNTAIYEDELQAYLIAQNGLINLNAWDNNTMLYSNKLNNVFAHNYFNYFGQTVNTTINNQTF